METIFSFLINASAGMVLFYALYWLLLRKETFYTANRWFLILALVSAVLLPIFPIQYSVFVEQQNQINVFQTISDTFKNIPVIVESSELQKSFSWQPVLLIIYLTGTAIFLFRLLTQTCILVRLMIKYRIKSLNGVRIVENEKYGLPFSFFNVIFINPKFHKQDDLPEILAHEKVHIRENHWFDLLLIELLTVIFWFNPFIWFFERSIKQNHEYLADKGVLAQGHKIGRYQAILLNQLMGMQIIGITNNLNFALNTNRLKMMMKKKTSAIWRLKFVMILPVLALLLFAFAEPQYQYQEQEFVGNDVSIREIAGQKQFTINGKVVRADTGEPLPGASVIIKGTTIGTVADLDGRFTLVDSNPKIDESTGALSTRVVVSFVGLKTVENVVSVSGTAIDNAMFTFKMEEVVILIDTEIPPPPPPPSAPKTKKESSNLPPPPPPPKVKEVTKIKKGDKELYIVDDVPGEEKEVFFVVEDMPKYQGGHWSLVLYVNNMQKKLAKDKGLKGKAKVGFTIDQKGKVIDIKIIEKDNDGVAKGAVVIVKGMEPWTPGKQRGKAVPVKFIMPVEFK